MPSEVGPRTRPVFPEGGSADDLARARQARDVNYDGSALFPETGEPDFSTLGHEVDAATDTPAVPVRNYDPNDHAVGVDGTMKSVRQADTTGDYV